MSQRAEVDKATADLDFKTKKYQVELKTSKGTITLDLLPELAAEHCRNFIGLSRIGFYNNLIFHRIIPGFMIQGGCPSGTGTGGPGYQVAAEFNATPHEAGVLSMARSGDPNSAGSQFFICLDKHSHLDGQYTAFGKTADESSWETVRQIGTVKTNASDRPVEEVKILSADVKEFPK